MYLVIAIIVFVAAIVYSGYDPKSAKRLDPGNCLSLYYIISFSLAVVWPIALIAVIMAGLGYGIFQLGKSFRKK